MGTSGKNGVWKKSFDRKLIDIHGHAVKVLPKAFLFDHDGVLVKSEKLHEEAWIATLKNLGLDFDIDLIEWPRLVGLPAPVLLERVFRTYSKNPTLHALSQSERDAIAHNKNDAYLTLAQSRLEPMHGARELLQFLHDQNIPCVVVSNAKTRELEFSLTTLKLKPYFKAVLSRDDVPAPKPSPLAYLEGALRCKTQPHLAVALDDTPTGLESALRAKIPAFAIGDTFPAHILMQPLSDDVQAKPKGYYLTLKDLLDDLLA